MVEIILGFAIGILAIAVWLLASGALVGDKPVKKSGAGKSVKEYGEYGEGRPEASLAPPSKLFIPSPPPKPRIAIIMDDLGADTAVAEKLLALDAPINFAVLPYLPHSKDVAVKATRAGMVVLLHLPMEPKGDDVPPGKGALYIKQGDAEIGSIVAGDLDSVPGATGVNNHMGSRFTEDGAKMAVALKEIKARKMFFVDSLTSPQSQAYETAVSMGLPAVRRDVFLDNEKDMEKITAQLEKLGKIARKRGYAIGIGHPYPETLEALPAGISAIKDSGVEIVKVTELIEQPAR